MDSALDARWRDRPGLASGRRSGCKRLGLRSLLLAVALVTLSAIPIDAQTTDVRSVFKLASPAVAFLTSYDANGNAMKIGSGFFVSKGRGLLVTNYHVIEGAHRVEVRLRNGAKAWADGVVDLDRKIDYAILQVSGANFPVVRIGNARYAEIGEPVVAIGNPEGLDFTVSEGIISQRRPFGDHMMLQISAPISHGSSGGPILNMRGEVIGVATAGVEQGQNLNFALPINYVDAALNEGTRVQWSLPDVAKWEGERDEAELMARLPVYEDPEGLFSMRVPGAWLFDRATQWDAENRVHINWTIFMPESAERAEVLGYLSEGIRIRVDVPAEGLVFVDVPLEEWAAAYITDLLKANPGFVATDSARITFSGQPAMVYSMVGQNENISEPEKSTFIFQRSKKYRLKIELVSPTSRLQDYETLFLLLLEEFSLSSALMR